MALAMIASAGCGEGDPSVDNVIAGGAHTCSLLADGRVGCWGANAHGQLGDDTTDGRATPVRVEGLSDAVEVALGLIHTCARKDEGTVWCWGNNETGQLGDGTQVSRRVPVQVRGLFDAVSIAAGDMHTCAARADGIAVCWGSNSSAQLGDGTTIDRVLPIPVGEIGGIVQVRAALGVEGVAHSCAQRRDGSVWCWGGNHAGQLGDGSTEQSGRPVLVRGLSGSRALSLGTYHACAVEGGGRLTCWGAVPATPLEALASLRFVDVAAGAVHTCGVVDDGSLRCFGDNVNGQLGAERPGEAGVVEVAGLSAVAGVSAGALHTCAVLDDASAHCWGENNNGRLGDGSVGGFRDTPVTVSELPD